MFRGILNAAYYQQFLEGYQHRQISVTQIGSNLCKNEIVKRLKRQFIAESKIHNEIKNQLIAESKMAPPPSASPAKVTGLNQLQNPR